MRRRCRAISLLAIAVSFCAIGAARADLQRPDFLLNTLRTSTDVKARAQAARELRQHGGSRREVLPDQTVPTLKFYAEKDRDEHVRAACASALGEVENNDPQVKELLARVASADTSTRVREDAVGALGKMAEKESRAASQRTAQLLGFILTHNASARVRERAAKALGDIGKKAAPALADIQKGMRDTNEDVCKESTRALGYLDPSQQSTTLPTLIAALNDPALRNNAIYGISHLGEKGLPALPQLIVLLKAKDHASSAAAYAIGCIGPKASGAIPALTEGLKRKDLSSGSCAWALSKMGAPARSTIPLMVPLLHHHDDRVRDKAAEALGSFGSASAVALPTLRRMAALPGKENIWSRRAAEDAIKKIAGRG